MDDKILQSINEKLEKIRQTNEEIVNRIRQIKRGKIRDKRLKGRLHENLGIGIVSGSIVGLAGSNLLQQIGLKEQALLILTFIGLLLTISGAYELYKIEDI